MPQRILLQVVHARGQTNGIIVWSLILIGVVVVGLAVVLRVKKSLTDVGGSSGNPAGFTLSDLRAMYQSGKMTEEEFERAKGKLIGTARKISVPKEGGSP